jgi:rfaE bifunctional protein nucleotidyltransferase chain/domain
VPPKRIQARALAHLAQSMRDEGRRLVLTNGCFDLLHVGHVRYLREARMLGDALAVAINDDASTGRLKGPGRPVAPAEERAEIVGALESVDFVTVFGEDTAAKLVDAVRPAVYVKGGDYSDDPSNERFPPEGLTVLGYGGEVRIVDFVAGISTSAILRKLQEEV